MNTIKREGKKKPKTEEGQDDLTLRGKGGESG